VSETSPPEGRRSVRNAAERAADHAGIDRLANELLPSLMAKLTATGLGELEVREGAWKVRLRRPAEGAAGGRKTERSGRSAGGHAHGGGTPSLTPVGPGRDERDGRDGHGGADGRRAVATSPAVGVFQPRPEARTGTRVRAGDRLGGIDVLGVSQEVVAPVDGVVGASLVESGDAVEYGQELIVIELAMAPAADA
jgi:acetyl-CoA carboxylase biotin carboxyl carrier protein